MSRWSSRSTKSWTELAASVNLRAVANGSVALERLLVGLIGVLLVWGTWSYGLWDPWELDIAEAARGALPSEMRLQDPAPLRSWLIHWSLTSFGLHAFAARLPGLLGGLTTCALAYLLFRRHAGRREALTSIVILGSTPLFLLNDRLAMGHGIGFATQTWVALAAFNWCSAPASTRARFRASLGLGASIPLSALSNGALLGPLPPLLAVGAWSVLTRDTEGRKGDPMGRTVLLAIAATLMVGVVRAVIADSATPSVWLGGGAVGGNPPTFDKLFEVLFHGLAPWSAVVPVAGAWLLAPRPGRCVATQDLSWMLGLWATFSYVAWTIFASRYGNPPYLAVVPLAGLVALWMGEVLDSKQAQWPSLVVALVLLGLLLRDFALHPDSVLRGLATDGLEVPDALRTQGHWIALFGMMAVLLCLFLVGPPRLNKPRFRLDSARAWPALFGGVVLAAYLTNGLQPSLSLYFSPKAVYEAYRHVAGGSGEPIATYRTSSRAAAYHTDAATEEIVDRTALIAYLRGEGQRWAILESEELPRLNRAYRRNTGRHLYVADASSARFVLVAATPIEGRPNQSFIAQQVHDRRPEIAHPLDATFADHLRLLGFDLRLPEDDSVGPGQRLMITWYWQLIGKAPKGYDVFVHIDGHGMRLNGDHAPVGGRYPFRLWEPGDVVADRQELEVPRDFPSGDYTIYVGVFKGGERLDVASGPQDGENRVRAGTLRVR